MNKLQNEKKKSLLQENIELKIENEVIKGQLKSVYQILSDILKEPIRKEIEQVPTKCINCQEWGYYNNSFCPICLEKSKTKEDLNE